MRSRVRRPMAVLALLATMVVSGVGFTGMASADEYDPEEAGHPLRITAYALHPVGVILDTLIFRPAHWVVHHEPLTTLFGHSHW
jgi:hypothetical protein